MYTFKEDIFYKVEKARKNIEKNLKKQIRKEKQKRKTLSVNSDYMESPQVSRTRRVGFFLA